MTHLDEEREVERDRERMADCSDLVDALILDLGSLSRERERERERGERRKRVGRKEEGEREKGRRKRRKSKKKLVSV